MIKIYAGKKLDNVSHVPLMDFYWGPNNIGTKRYGDSAIKLLNKQFFILVEDPAEADYLLIPHYYFYIRNQEYVDSYITISKKYGKKIIVISYGDSDKYIDIPNCIIFRSSQYAYKKKENEIIMPAIADDLLGNRDLVLRNKVSVPVVSFCGWAGFENHSRMLIEKSKNLSIWLRKVFVNKNIYFHNRGLIFRIKAIGYLKSSKLLVANFIIRDSFSGNEKTRKIDLDQARAEYVSNIVDSDLSLAVKGDGNFSIRFYEILSLGRIPLFVDTNCSFPLEDVINYSDFVLKVDCRNLSKIGEQVSKYYANISPKEFLDKQNMARSIFENYLRIDKYFDYVLREEFLSKY